jgi:hypothetical protein
MIDVIRVLIERKCKKEKKTNITKSGLFYFSNIRELTYSIAITASASLIITKWSKIDFKNFKQK